MIAQIGPLAELVAAEALRHLPAVIRKKEDRQEAADHSRSKTRNQRWIDFLRSTRVEFWHRTGSRARSGSRSERTLDAVEHSRTLMEWWPFLIFHRGGLRIKVINNNSKQRKHPRNRKLERFGHSELAFG